MENGYPEYLPGFPEQPIEEVPANIPEPDAEWMRFYAVKRGRHPNARGGFTTTSALTMMNFPLLAHIDEISLRPILFVVGDQAHSKFFSENAYAAALEPKELCEVAGAEHIDLYDRTDRIPFDKLTEEFARGARETGNQVEKIELYNKTIGFCKGLEDWISCFEKAAAGLLTLEELYAAKRLARDKYHPPDCLGIALDISGGVW